MEIECVKWLNIYISVWLKLFFNCCYYNIRHQRSRHYSKIRNCIFLTVSQSEYVPIYIVLGVYVFLYKKFSIYREKQCKKIKHEESVLFLYPIFPAQCWKILIWKQKGENLTSIVFTFDLSGFLLWSSYV